ncbi:MAG: flagellar FliJ protein [Alphaproteobacteria bacterium]|jgi:flagellar FliJ protein
MSGVSNMKARESALRAKRFEADEKNRKVDDLEQMINEFERMAYDLECQVKAEEERTGVRDAQHFAYSTFARSAEQRRQNLLASVTELQGKLDSAVAERDDAVAELDEADAVRDRDESRNQRPSNLPVN